MKNPPSLKSHGSEYESVFPDEFAFLASKLETNDAVRGIGEILPEIEILEKFFLKKYHNFKNCNFAQILNFFASAAPTGTALAIFSIIKALFAIKLMKLDENICLRL